MHIVRLGLQLAGMAWVAERFQHAMVGDGAWNRVMGPHRALPYQANPFDDDDSSSMKAVADDGPRVDSKMRWRLHSDSEEKFWQALSRQQQEPDDIKSKVTT